MTNAVSPEAEISVLEQRAENLTASIKCLKSDLRERLQDLRIFSTQHLALRVRLQLEKLSDAGIALCMDPFCTNITPIPEMRYLFIWGKRGVRAHPVASTEYYRELYHLCPSCLENYRERHNSKIASKDENGAFYFRDSTPLEEQTTLFVTPTSGDLLRKGVLNDGRKSIEVPSPVYVV